MVACLATGEETAATQMSQQHCTGTAINRECGVRVAELVAGKTAYELLRQKHLQQ